MPRDSYAARAAWTAAIGVVALVFVAALYLARGALILIYISVLLAVGVGPLVHAIEHQWFVAVGIQRLPRWFATLVVYLAIVGLLTVIGFLVVPPLVAQEEELRDRLPSLIDRAQTFLIERGWLTHRVTLEEAVLRTETSPGRAVGTVATAVTRVVRVVLAFVTILILTFYLLVESRALFAGFARLFPRQHRARVIAASDKISTKVSAWLSGQLILAGTIGTTAAVGLYLLGVPYFYVLALVAAAGELIPVIGPILSAVPAILVALSVSPKTALFVALFWIAQQQIENHLLVPKIMQRQVGVNPVVVISALLLGGSILGILGAVLAVPTAAIIQVVVQELLDERDNTAP